VHCGSGFWGGQRPSLGGYVTGTGATRGCPPPEGVDVACPLPSVFIGTVDHIVDEMRGRRERYGISYYVFFDQLMETVAPLVTRLAGE